MTECFVFGVRMEVFHDCLRRLFSKTLSIKLTSTVTTILVTQEFAQTTIANPIKESSVLVVISQDKIL